MIPLVVRSGFSLMRGAATVEELAAAAKRMGYASLALTDTDNLYGLMFFIAACKREGVRPIAGAELTEPGTGRRAVCLVENDEGYKNLCRLITHRQADERFDLAGEVERHSQGLTLLAAEPELLGRWRNAGAFVAAMLPRGMNVESTAARATAHILGVPAVAVPDSFFIAPADYEIHRMLRAIDLNTSLSRLPPGKLAPRDAWLAAPEEYARRFTIFPEAVAATHDIAARCAFTAPGYGTVLPPWRAGGAKEELRRLSYEGARKRYGEELSEAAIDRLEYELGLIELKGFSSYFLVVREIVMRSPRICGRGSGAASLVAYCLGITNVCPLKYNLYFERFLNPGRKDPPDIDIDFAWDERDAVINSVLEEFAGHAAMVCNHVLFQPRMAVREVAKVFGLADAEIGAMAKKLPHAFSDFGLDIDPDEKLSVINNLMDQNLPAPWPAILRMAARLVLLPRNLSVHSGGVVITSHRLDEYVPVEMATKGVPVVQWEKDSTEEAGLVKIDLLGNRSLGVIRDAIANIRENGELFDERAWEPEDDPATQQAVAAGKTMGCFYIESPAMRQLLKKCAVGDFEHLVILSSIIRPAANEFIREYISRLKGAPWTPIHPLLTEVLDETLGVMVYQEDVSKVAVALAGFSHAEADGLRKILSKKDREYRIKDYYQRFHFGALERGVTPEQVESIWAMMMSFDGYSFCKPHSASYARVSFQAAYLKVHHPAEFMAAVISNQGGFYGAFAYVSEARRMGCVILPPDVNESAVKWKGRRREIRVGFLSVKNLGNAMIDRIAAARIEGRFRSFDDFLARVRPDEEEARSLIACGGCDAFLENPGQRGTLLWRLAREKKGTARRAVAAGLFDGMENIPAPFIPPQEPVERLRGEFSTLGFLCAAHPMLFYQERLRPFAPKKADTLERHVGRRIAAAGIMITSKTVSTKKGEAMKFVTFEDETGLVESVFFPDAYRRYADVLEYGKPFLLYGLVEDDFGAQSFTVERVRRLA